MATRKTTARKTTTPKSKPTATPETGAEVDAATVADAADAPGQGAPTLRKKEFFARVKARASGVKGTEVRVVLDAVLEELGALLVEGDGLTAQPLGTLKVQKRRTLSGAEVVVCKLRRKKPASGDKDPLAEAAE